MKIILNAIIFWLSVFSVFAGESDYMSGNSLVATYYAKANRLLKSNPVDCMFWADKAISESVITGNKLDLGRGLFIKGLALEQLHQNKASLKFFHESLKVAEYFKLGDLEMDALEKLSKLYARTGDYKSAVVYASLLYDRKDSNAISSQRLLVKTLPGKVDLQKSENRMKQLIADKSVLDDHLRFNLKIIDNQGNWILIIVIGYGLIFLSFFMISRQNKLILLKNQVLTDQMLTLEDGKMELEHTRYKAEESDRLKTAFLANISHEIKSPLNAIVSFSGFLRQKGIPAAERKSYIDVIHQYSESLLSLIKEIFEVARIESGEIKQDPEMIDMIEFLKDIHNLYCSGNIPVIRKDFKLILNLQTKMAVTYVKTYPTRLRNVLLHLIENALKYSENGKVEYGYIVKGSFIEFYVMDDGKGLRNENPDEIFERFKTKADHAKSGIEPLGLGLTISKNFIESLGGHIWLEPNIIGGSTFFFTIPLNPEIKQ
jgi:signal transduction histidine kinase